MRECIFLWVQKRFESCTNIIGSRRFKAFLRPLTYKRNKWSANIDI